MNKRLQELMREAGYAAPELAGRANKLAELLVKECADQVDDYFCDFYNKTAADKIKEHFGVEE